MTATRLDLTIEQGADYDSLFSLSFDPTGHTAVMQVKPVAGYPFAILTLRSSTGGLVVDGPNRTITPVIPAAVAAAINAGRYAYDLKLTSPAGRAIRAYQGMVHVSEQITDYEEPPADVATDFLTQGGFGLVFQDGSGWALPEAAASLLTFQDGSDFAFQDGAVWLLPQGVDADSPTFSLQDGSSFSFQDGSPMLLPAGMAGVLAAFQDGAEHALQNGSTLQIA